jgi:NTP pyrophosphatase (non-canonical NTP hydrolase)
MEINEYQEKAMKTAIYGMGYAVNYPILGLVGEAGELANKYKKILRDNGGVLTPEKSVALIDELGDVFWYGAALARDLGVTLQDVCELNLSKLAARQATGTIHDSEKRKQYEKQE